MGVEFQEDNSRRDFERQSTPKLARWLISKKIASDVATANKIQIIAAVVFLLLAAFIYFKF